MMCFIYKWFISLAADEGKAVPGWVNRHMEACPSCKSFARIGAVMERKMTGDADELFKQTDESLSHRILASLHTQPEHAYRRTLKRSPRRFVLVPAMAAAVLMLVVGGFFFINDGNGVPVVDETLPGYRLAAIENPPATLANLFSSAESPMEDELQSLVKNVESAKEYFTTYLDFRDTGE